MTVAHNQSTWKELQPAGGFYPNSERLLPHTKTSTLILLTPFHIPIQLIHYETLNAKTCLEK